MALSHGLPPQRHRPLGRRGPEPRRTHPQPADGASRRLRSRLGLFHARRTWPQDTVAVPFVHNSQPQDLLIPEGLTAPWHATICRRALVEGVRTTQVADNRWSDIPVIQKFGVATYLVEPVEDIDGILVGTLCAVSTRRVPIDPKVLPLFSLCARLIAFQIARDDRRPQPVVAVDKAPLPRTRDALTGLVDGPTLERELAHIIREEVREGGRVCVAFVRPGGLRGDRTVFFNPKVWGRLPAGDQRAPVGDRPPGRCRGALRRERDRHRRPPVAGHGLVRRAAHSRACAGRPRRALYVRRRSLRLHRRRHRGNRPRAPGDNATSLLERARERMQVALASTDPRAELVTELQSGLSFEPARNEAFALGG